LPVTAAEVSHELGEIADAAQAAEDQAVIDAPLITEAEAAALDRRRQRTPEEAAAMARHRLGQRWGLGPAAPSLQLLGADGLMMGARA
jgi:hypothetical protein